MQGNGENWPMAQLGRDLAHQSILESIIWVLIRDDPSLLDRLRARLDDYQPKALRLLPAPARAVYEDRLTRFLLDLEDRHPDA